MFLLKTWKSFLFIVLAAIIGFSSFSCGSEKDNNPIDIENLPPLREDVILPGHTTIQTWSGTTATALVGNIKLGWNLGNTFDAHGDEKGFSWLGGGVYAKTSVADMEKAWVGSVTTEANITAIKNAGFNAIRIPVTWYKALDKNYIIREDWLKRITEVINYAENNDMYIILNTHHDEGIFKFTDSSIKNSLIIFERVWVQIATQFQNYNEKLIFEGLNEPRTKGGQNEWNGGTKEERDNLNKYYQVFVDTVRVSGGNNDKRFLMVNTFAASAGQTAVDGLVLPEDTAESSIIVSIHAYEPFYYAHEYPGESSWESNKSKITDVINRASTTFVSKGIPVILGEFGARVEKAGSTRNDWAKFYVGSARQKNIPCLIWDDSGNFKLLDRTANTISSDYLDALMSGAGNGF